MPTSIPSHPTPPLLDTDAAAEYLGLRASTLVTLRSRGGGPPYVKLGRRVLYRPADLERYVAARVTHNTLEAEMAKPPRPTKAKAPPVQEKEAQLTLDFDRPPPPPPIDVVALLGELQEVAAGPAEATPTDLETLRGQLGTLRVRDLVAYDLGEATLADLVETLRGS